ncbi:MAG TPA: M18 family aminopeptidase [Fibrobacteria bacterium]|nr:M18 family aminopeptidase [Fibrobacteria bacterium]
MRNPSADSLLAFLNASPTPWHATEVVARRLDAAGAVRLREEEVWALRPGQTALVVRGGATIAALRVPDSFSVRRPLPFHIVAAHTDSPCLRLKPRPLPSQHGYRQWGVEVYGGILNNSWLDRDLGIAGRVCTPDGTATLVRFENAPVRIPQLAIHLDRNVNETGPILNPQRHLVPLLGQGGARTLEARLEEAAGAPFDDLTFDLCLYDVQAAAYGGLNDEFVYAGRLDNLAMCHAALSAFLDTPAAEVVQVMVLFDHEEVGSVSAQGAKSNFLAALLERAMLALGVDREAWLRLLPQSFLISADMAHALHPNYPERHDGEHFPLPNRGPVLKANANQRYATDAASAARLLRWARQASVPVQDFINRADLACGSTVGPGLSADLGIPAVDVGSAMLSMHSAREMGGADDPAQMEALMRSFFRGQGFQIP